MRREEEGDTLCTPQSVLLGFMQPSTRQGYTALLWLGDKLLNTRSLIRK